MPRKNFEAGMVAGAKPFEEKFKKQAEAVEKIGSRMDKRLDQISSVVDVMMDDLSAQERKRVYDLNTVVDIAEMDKTEKEYLCAIIYAISKLNTQLSQEQQEYLRALKSYLKVVNIQTDVDLASIENIESITTQKAIMQTIMEFLFLEYGNHDYMDDYEDVFDYFSVNRKGIREIQNSIDAMYEAVGIEGIAEHYGSITKINVVQGATLSDKELDLRKKAEEAYLEYRIKDALPLFNILAEQGDGRSCYFLGQIYEFGYQGAVRCDKSEAKKYREKGAAKGDLLCKMRLADSARDKQEKEAIYAETYEEVLALAQNGDIYAMFEVARLFDFAYEPLKDNEKARYWYTLSANMGFWGAMANLGNFFYNANDFSDAVLYYQKSADIGCESAISTLAGCYSDGKGVAKNVPKAMELYQKAATLGNPNAQRYMGLRMMHEEKYVQAQEWYKKAVDGGNADAYYDLAEAYYRDDDIGMFDGEEYSMLNLIHGAVAGDRRAIIELCGRRGMVSFTIKRLFDAKKLDDFSGKLCIDGSEFDLGADWNEFEKKFEVWTRDETMKYAEAGESAAQYYLGMDYVTKYEYHSDSNDKALALKWLRLANEDRSLFAPNLDKTLKCLNKFFTANWPSRDEFV